MDTRAKKSLGQNFLTDTSVIEAIFSIADVRPDDWVLEIGPGTGALTFLLSERVERLMAIELDRELVRRLQDHFIDSKHVSVLEGNILDIHLEEVISESSFGAHGYKIIANIPYYITAPIIRTLLSLKERPSAMTLMVQDEVAERLAAPPGKMSLLSVMAQYYSDVEKKLFVPKEAFDPSPKVESAIVHLVPKRPYDQAADQALFRIVRAGFSARRKTLANNLSAGFSVPREKVEEMLLALGLRKDVRAQALSVEEWMRLQEALEADLTERKEA